MDMDGFNGGGDAEHDVEAGVGAGCDGERLNGGGEAGGRDGEGVDAERDLGEGEFALGVGGGVHGECGVAGLERDRGAGDRAVLGIVDHAVQRGEYGGECGKRCTDEDRREQGQDGQGGAVWTVEP